MATLSPQASAGIWVLIFALSFILGVSFGLFTLSYTFAIATWNKAVTTIENMFGKYVVLKVTSPLFVALFVSLAVLVNYLRRRSLSQLFSDFRFGTAGTRSVLICILAIIALFYIIAQFIRPETFLVPIVDWIYSNVYKFFTTFISTAMQQAFQQFGKAALLLVLLGVYIFLFPILVRFITGLSARDLATVSAIATVLGIVAGAISIPLALTSLEVLQDMWNSIGMSSLGVFAGLLVLILILVAIEDIRRWLMETKFEHLVNLPAGLVILSKLMYQWMPNIYGTVMGLVYTIAVLLVFAVYFIGIAMGKNSWVAATCATFPMLLYIHLT